MCVKAGGIEDRGETNTKRTMMETVVELERVPTAALVGLRRRSTNEAGVQLDHNAVQLKEQLGLKSST